MRNGLSRKGERRLVVLIVLFAAVYRLYGMTGNITHDPAVYAQEAFNVLHGTFDLDTDSWFSHRLPVFVPVAFVYGALGVGDLQTNLWPLTLSILQILAVVWIGRRLVGRGAALLGAFLLAVHPLDATFAGILSPDIVLASLLTFSCAFWLAGLEEKARYPRLLLFLSGVTCGLAIDTRVYAFFIALSFAAYAIWRKIDLRSLLWWVVGIAAVIVPIVLIYAFATGDPLLPGRALVRLARDSFYRDPAYAATSSLLYYPRLLLRLRSNNGSFAIFFAAAAVWAVLRPTRARVILLAWIAPLLVFLQFGSFSLHEYVPVYKVERLLTPFLAPGALLAASVAIEGAGVLGRAIAGALRAPSEVVLQRALVAAGVLLLSANSFWIVKTHRDSGVAASDNFKSAARLLRADTSVPILFDHWRTAIQFGYYFDFEEGSHLYGGADETQRMLKGPRTAGTRLGYLKWYEDPATLPDAFVVLEQGVLAEAEWASAGDPTRSKFPAKDIPLYAHDPPDSWRLAGQFGTIRILRTGSTRQ